MIRITAIAALTLLLIFVLYLPSVHSPARFTEQIRVEHELNKRFWGPEATKCIMERSLAIYGVLNSATPVPQRNHAPDPTRLSGGVAAEMARVNTRFFENSYFRAVDALVLLATYRWASQIQWGPAVALLVLAMFIDGWLLRVIRSLEFRGPSPEWFAVYACTIVILTCGAAVCFVLPMTIPPLWLGTMPALLGLCLSKLVANYHHRP